MRLTVGAGAGPVPDRPVQRARWRPAAVLRRLLGHLRPRQRGRARPGALRGRRRAALLPGPERAGHGARRRRLRAHEGPAADVRLHLLDRPGRDQHGHRGRAGHREPAPGTAAPGDVFATRPASPVLQELEDPRIAGHLGQRLPAAGVPLLRPDLAARAAALRPAAGDAGADRPGRDGRGHAGAAAGHRGGGARLAGRAVRPRIWRMPRPGRSPSSLAEAADAIRAARRPLLVAGGGVHYSGADGGLARASLAPTGIPVAETQAGKGAMPLRPSGRAGRDRRDRDDRRQRASRPRRDLVIGVGTRWSDFTTASSTLFGGPAPVREPERRRRSTRPSSPRCRWWRTPAPAWRSSPRHWRDGTLTPAYRESARAPDRRAGTPRWSARYHLGHRPGRPSRRSSAR